MTRPLALVITLAGFSACAHHPRCELPAMQQPGTPLIWRAQRGAATLWLYGTIHDLGGADVPDEAWRLLDGADKFASELGDVEPDGDVLRKYARLPFGKALDQLISADAWIDLRTALAGTMTDDDLRHARPWLAMSRLQQHEAPGAKPSMDEALANHARQHGRPIVALETWDTQLAAVDAAVSPADLAEAIAQRKTMECSSARLHAAYEAADVPALTAALVVPATHDLVGKRNAAWLPELEQIEGSAFVAVGLGHLLGAGGLPAQLARDGYAVTAMRIGAHGVAPLP